MVQEGGMAAFGEELRRAREERGMAVETICDATKVSAKHIRALEAGALKELPGGVFRRGFVRSYLRVLGLEENAWMERFEESCRASGMLDPAEMEWVTFAENVKNSRVAPRRRAGLRWVMVGLVLLGASAGWVAVGGDWRPIAVYSLHPCVWAFLNSWVDNGPSR